MTNSRKILLRIFCIMLICGYMQKVSACGEIYNLTSSIGEVVKIDKFNYTILIPDGTDTLDISANSKYPFIDGYGPRTVSTNSNIKLRVNGDECGQGIYSYIISFKTKPTLVAQNNNESVQNNKETIENSGENVVNNDEIKENNQNIEADAGPFLKELSIFGYEIVFNKITREYRIDVENSVRNIEINAIPEDEEATINISDNASNLLLGENKIIIEVTDKFGAKSEYNIVVNKLKLLSNNAFLSSIKIDNAILNFDSSIDSYTINIDKVKSLNITAVTQSEFATYEVLNNKNLKSGDKVIIRVTAENGNVKDYILKVMFNFRIKDYLIYFGVLGGILVLVTLLVIRKNKRKKIKPQVIQNMDVQEQTAGKVSESSNNNMVGDAVIESTENANLTEKNENFSGEKIENVQTNVKLEYIIPTDIEATKELSNIIQNIEDNPKYEDTTELFKL